MHPLSEGTITQTLELLHSGSADARGTVTYQGNFALRCAPKHIAREAGGFLSTTEAAIETSHHVRTAFANPTRRNRCGTLSKTGSSALCARSTLPYIAMAHVVDSTPGPREHLAERQR